MARIPPAGAIVSVLLVLGGCASLSEDECLTSDWRAIGFEDGARGYSAERIGRHRKACAKHGVQPDLDAYREGRKQGLRDFCRPERGFTLGSGGGHYNGVCAPDLEPAFVDAYKHGQHLHTLRANVTATDHEIDARRRELERVEDAIRDAETALVGRDTPAAERVLLLADLKELSGERGHLEAEIEALIEERAAHEQQLAAYQADLAGSGY